jgi:hypothetical protein
LDVQADAFREYLAWSAAQPAVECGREVSDNARVIYGGADHRIGDPADEFVAHLRPLLEGIDVLDRQPFLDQHRMGHALLPQPFFFTTL